MSANPKLSTRLKKALLVTLFTVLVLATIAAAVTSYLEASEIQDETLLSIAQLVNSNQVGAQTLSTARSHRKLDNSAIRIWEMGRQTRYGLSIKENQKLGFDTVSASDDLWRVLVTQHPDTRKRFAIAQKLSVSAELAFKSAVNTALPLLLLLLLIPLLITLIVRHSFKPLNKLTAKISAAESLTLDLSNDEEIPVEVVPFVSAIDSLLDNNAAHNMRQKRFIADAAHELRTPITALSLEIDNLEKSKDEGTRQVRQKTLSNSVSRLQRLVNQLLDLARAQSVGQDDTHRVSLNDFVKSQIADLYVLAEEKDIELSVTQNDAVTVQDKNNQLQHLLRNGISNAIKFTPIGGQIEIEIAKEGAHAQFRVIDTGPGVEAEHLEKLQQPFFRPAEQATSSGAGLGLAICSEVASTLGGELTLENVLPTGFRFSYSQPWVE